MQTNLSRTASHNNVRHNAQPWQGLYKAAPSGPFIPGLEFSGVITAIHPEPSPLASPPPSTQPQQQQQQQPLKPGDRVIGVTRFGAWATRINLDTSYLRPIPRSWSFEEGASFAVQALTAAHGLNLGDLRAACRRRPGGATVLLQSAAGGVGLQALAICRAHGARVLGLVGSEGKAEALRQLLATREQQGLGGASSSSSSGDLVRQQQQQESVISVVPRMRGDAEIRTQLWEWLDRQGVEGFDVFFDSAGGDYLRPGFEALAPCGRWVGG